MHEFKNSSKGRLVFLMTKIPISCRGVLELEAFLWDEEYEML